MTDYIALIHKDAASDYGVSFPDLPGCVTAGVTLDEAKAAAAEALALHLEGLREDNAEAPAPSSLEEVMANREHRDAVAFLVPTPDRTARAVRVNITLPEDVLMQIDRYAEAQGFTRSGLLLQGARRIMGQSPEPMNDDREPGAEPAKRREEAPAHRDKLAGNRN